MKPLGEALVEIYRPRRAVGEDLERLVELRPSSELEQDWQRARQRLGAELAKLSESLEGGRPPRHIRSADAEVRRRLELVKLGRRRDLLALAYGCWCLGLGGRSPRPAWRERLGFLTVDGGGFDELVDYCECPVGRDRRAECERLLALGTMQAEAERLGRTFRHVPLELRNVTLDTYPDDTLEQRESVATLRAWAAHRSPWLVMFGEPGVGKSGLAIAAARETGAAWAFVMVCELLDELRATFDRDRNMRDLVREADLLGHACSAELLILDDLDKQPGTDWAVGVLYGVIYRREAERRRTIITANKGPGAIESRLGDQGDAVLSRVLGAAGPFVFEVRGPDLRQR